MAKNESLEIKKKRLELSKVRVAKEELEFKIEERLEDISRLKEHIAVQEKRERELEGELNE
jgi:hypothetical protein